MSVPSNFSSPMTPQQIEVAMRSIEQNDNCDFLTPENQVDFWRQVTYALGTEMVTTAKSINDPQTVPVNWDEPGFRIFCGSWLLWLNSERE